VTLASNALLAVGYPVAVAAGARLVPALRQRRHRRLATLEGAMGAIVAGHALAGRWPAVAVNAATLVGFALAWAVATRRP